MKSAAVTILVHVLWGPSLLGFVVCTLWSGSTRLWLALAFWLSLSKGAEKEGREKVGECSVGVTSMAFVEDGALNQSSVADLGLRAG